ncbi:MAG TPA: DNA repair protein RecO [Bacteroidia bacterium]|jgi:DNA repair protein RecO (recombination protein O)|nr:DNA repair protein RecO [Bacteroidia bacterium]
MYTTTEAIVLQLHPYKDKSAVVKLYSAQMGLISCWVGSVHGKKSKTKSAILQPLSLIKAEISYRENNNMPQLKEISVSIHTPNIPMGIEKSSLALFLSELLLHCLKESSSDLPLYSFIKDTVCLLDTTKEKCSNFHIVFLVRLCEHLGLLPDGNYSAQTPYFNLEESTYQKEVPLHPHFLFPAESECLSNVSTLPMEQFYLPTIPSALRKNLLHGLLEYYVLHLGMSPLKSHLILEEVL